MQSAPAKHFIRQIVEEDLASGKHRKIITRFPPEPNGYLHIGHAKSICLNFGLARDYQGECNLRFDDTNPAKEDVEYVNSIMKDVQWMGFQWQGKVRYASEYFQQLYDCAVALIKKGKAYVCDLSADEVRKYRGTLTEPGKPSPNRQRSVEENLVLFEKMKNGGFADGACTLRAKIDMASPNINMRDPAIYRIRKEHHHQTGDQWCIYPMYDYAHCISDSVEHITHSLCTLEFEDHRPLYDWILDQLAADPHPRQIEFSRLNLDYTVMSKRILKQLVDEKHVKGWDDPRMPTISGLRRRGFTAQAIRNFCERIGITKKDSVIEYGNLEDAIRDDLNQNAPRSMAVLQPLKVVIESYSAEKTETIDSALHPQRPEMGSRKITFSREIYIEQSDFMENPPNKFFRLGPGREVRLRNAYIIKCIDFKKDPKTGQITELRCTHDPDTLGKNPADGRKIKGTIHWVSVPHSIPAEVRLYDRLFNVANPSASGAEFLQHLNPQSLVTLKDARVESNLASAESGQQFQFERQGYFCVDPDSQGSKTPIFNRVVTLRDTWGKISQED